MKVVQLLEYSRYLRHGYLEVLAKLSWEEMIKDRGASFNSFRNIYLHCIAVLDFYVNHLIQGDVTYPRINYEDYDDMQKIIGYLEQVESKADMYLRQVTQTELSRKIERKLRDGSTITVTVEDILIDFFQEETHHRGELLALLWQIDITPPHIGWTQYLATTKSITTQ